MDFQGPPASPWARHLAGKKQLMKKVSTTRRCQGCYANLNSRGRPSLRPGTPGGSEDCLCRVPMNDTLSCVFELKPHGWQRRAMQTPAGRVPGRHTLEGKSVLGPQAQNGFHVIDSRGLRHEPFSGNQCPAAEDLARLCPMRNFHPLSEACE